MPKRLVPKTGTRNLHQKLARQIWPKFITVSFTKTTLRPITLHGSCHMPQFLTWNRPVLNCEQETCTRKKLLPDWLTHVQVSCTSFWYKCLERVSLALRIWPHVSFAKPRVVIGIVVTVHPSVYHVYTKTPTILVFSNVKNMQKVEGYHPSETIFYSQLHSGIQKDRKTTKICTN